MSQTARERSLNIAYSHPSSVARRAMERIEPGSEPAAILKQKHLAELAEMNGRHRAASIALTHAQEREWQASRLNHGISISTRPHVTEVNEAAQVDRLRAEQGHERATVKARHRVEEEKLAATHPAP